LLIRYLNSRILTDFCIVVSPYTVRVYVIGRRGGRKSLCGKGLRRCLVFRRSAYGVSRGSPLSESEVSPLDCPCKHSCPSDGMNISGANRAVSDIGKESCSVHFILLCDWGGGVAFEPLALLATRHMPTAPLYWATW